MQDKPYKSKMEGIIDLAMHAVMTVEEREAQRRSFAFGNVSMHNPDVTREMIDKVAEEKIDPEFDERCSVGHPDEDGKWHCGCWYDGDGCCRCKSPAMTDEQKRAQGMEE